MVYWIILLIMILLLTLSIILLNIKANSKVYCKSLENPILISKLRPHKIYVNKFSRTLSHQGKSISYDKCFNFPPQENLDIINSKAQTFEFMKNFGYPSPQTVHVKDFTTANLSYPLVLKPIHGHKGNGIITDIYNKTQLNSHLKKIKNKENYLIQEQAEGKVYRVTVFNNKVLYIYHRVPPILEGDGKRTIAELIQLKKEEIKKINKYTTLDVSQSLIEKQGYQFDDILPKYEKIKITNLLNSNKGTTELKMIPITQLHPLNHKMFCNITKHLKMNIIGFDYISPSIQIPFTKAGNILEMNSRPDLSPLNQPNSDKLVRTFISDLKEVMERN